MESKSRERQQFEDAWVNDNSSTPDDANRVRDALNRIWVVNEGGEGAYFDSFVMQAWSWWQKSRAALVVELPNLLQPYADGPDDWYLHSDPDGEYMNADDVIESIRAAGITVKGEGDE